MTIKKIVYVEPYIGGHHPIYTKLIIRELLRQNIFVTLITVSNFDDGSLIDKLDPEFSGKLQILKFVEPANQKWFAIESFNLWVRLRRAYLKSKSHGVSNVDRVIVSNITELTIPIGILGSPFERAPLAGLLISGRNFRNSNRKLNVFGWIKKRISQYSIGEAKIKCLVCLDPLAKFGLQKIENKNGSKIVHREIPYTVKVGANQLVARAHFGINKSSFVVLAFGKLSNRKGLDVLIQSVRETDVDICVLIVGEADDDTKHQLQQYTKSTHGKYTNLNAHLVRVDEHGEAMAFAAANVVWVAYPNFFDTSGVLLSAYAYGKPAIGNNCGNIELSIQTNKTGLTIDPDSVLDAKKAILSLYFETKKTTNFGISGKIYANKNSPEYFFPLITKDLIDFG